MRIRKLLVLSAAAAVGWAGFAAALDSPHDGSVPLSPTECQSCHKLHSSTGGTMLNGYSDNNHACITCHDTLSTPFTSGWATGREASTLAPGKGDQHNWSGLPTGAGAQRPADAGMATYLPTDTTLLQCAVCHDVHGKRDATGSIQQTFAPNSAHTSFTPGTTYPKTSGGTGNGQLAVSKPAVGAKAAGYRIRLVTATTFVISHNSNLPAAQVKWWNYAGGTWTEGVAGAAPVSGKPFTSGSAVTTDDPNLSVTIVNGSQAFTGGEYWTFYVSYPFLRAANDLDQMCVDCHRDRNMTHTCVEGSTDPASPCYANGVNKFSHPVQEAMGAVGGTTVAPASMLDADGTPGVSITDGAGGVQNDTNNLNLVGGQVRCTTCHAPHNADSNSLSVDAR